MVGLGRLELPTSRLSGVRSNHLSYKPLKRPYLKRDVQTVTVLVAPQSLRDYFL